MVDYKLMISAEVENVHKIEPMGGVNDPSFLRCENCGEVTTKETCVTLEDVVPISKNRKVNLVQKCKFCSREGTVTMVRGGGSPFKAVRCRPLTGEDCEAGNYAPLMGFECRGLELAEYSFGGSMWKVVTTAGTVYENVELSGGDWVEYDEEGNMPVSVSNLKFRFEEVYSEDLKLRDYFWNESKTEIEIVNI